VKKAQEIFSLFFFASFAPLREAFFGSGLSGLGIIHA
jgi:hypothetical protein